jgi:peptide/nickel transport system substrate-binding protein
MKINKRPSSGFLKYALHIASILICTSCNRPAREERMVFRYNEQTGIATLDPAFAKNQSIIWAVHQIYNTLVETDDQLHLVPSLAQRWEVSEDRLKYTFHLRTDVFFQDNEAFPGGKGRRMVAGDVRYSFLRIMDPQVASPGAWIFHGRMDPDAGIEVINDSTIQLRLLKPFNPVLGMLSMEYCSVVPREVVEKYGRDFRSHPCGTGPFRMKYWEEGQDMILVKNDRYFEQDSEGVRLPYLDAVKITFFDNKATEFLQFRQGQLDFINDIDPSFKDEVLSKTGELKQEWQGKIVLSKHPYLNTEYLGILVDTSNFLLKQSPLRFKKIRQAINYGFDRKKMMMYLRNSIGEPAQSGFVPSGLPSFNDSLVKGYYFNQALSRQLLNEAGYPGGRGLPEIKLTSIDIYADMAGFIARQLEEVGLKLKVDIVQKAVLLEQTAKSEALFFRGSWIADYPDAENFLSVFYSKNPAPPNYTRYNNPIYDLLYEKSLAEKNDSVRYGLYREMDQLMIRDAPVVPLWYDEVIRLVGNRVSGFKPNGLNLLELRRVKLDTGK